FRLDGYGVFFDVEVPMLRQSVAWSLRQMFDQSGPSLNAAIDRIRQLITTVTDPRARQQFDDALRRIELQAGPAPGLAPAGSGVEPSAAQARPISPAALEWLNDPNGAYTSEVKNALIDAMLEHSGPLNLRADEWLTIAARDGEPSDRLNPGDDIGSIIIRIKGSDLGALHTNRITLQEARKRIEVHEN